MRKPSRGTELDRQKCVKMSGGNQFDMVLLAAARARELMVKEGQDNCTAPMSALLDIQNEKLRG